MGSPSKYSKEWYGNKGHTDGLKGDCKPPHDGILDHALGISNSSREKKDAYIEANKKGKSERERRS
jgi:hypothetical protein